MLTRETLLRLLREAIADWQFEDLLFDKYPDVHTVSQGQDLGERTRSLVAYVEKHGRVSELVAAVKKLSPKSADEIIAQGNVTTRLYRTIIKPEVSKLLESITIDEIVLEKLYRRHCPEGMDDKPVEWNVAECTKTLALCNSPQPATHFLADVANDCADAATGRAIRGIFGIQSSPAEPIAPICLVFVEPTKGDEGDTASTYTVTLYRWWSPQKAEIATTFQCDDGQLQDLIPKEVKDALHELHMKGIRTRAVEIVVPFEHIAGSSPACVEQWTIPRKRLSGKVASKEFPIGDSFPVALRCLDRWENSLVWLDTQYRLNSADRLVVKLADDGFRDGELPSENMSITGVVANRSLSEDELEEVVFSGVPLVLWLREPDSDGNVVDQLHSIASSEEVPERVFHRRCKQKDHIARHLALLHDMERRELPETLPMRNPSSKT